MIPKKQEKKLIEELRKKGIGVSRTEDKPAEELRKRKVPYQREVRIGMYRVDFYIPKSIVIDIQGSCNEELRQSIRN
jgi:very-short-patch-repair endonuclease